MGSGPFRTYDGYGSNRETTRIYVSSETVESVASGADSYATNTTFADLGVADALVNVLNAQGITTAFPIQAMTIAHALAGRDVCGKAKTGSGKTLGFGLPMLQRLAAGTTLGGANARPARPRGLVLLPTRELAVQVYEVIAPLGKALGLNVAAVYGGADIERQIKALRKGCDVIIATPGRLIDLGDRGEVNVEQLDVLVLDEADRMADMGFMPQVEWVLRRIANKPHQTLLFSATLDGAIDRLVSRYLTDPVRHEVASSTQTVSQMEHRFLNIHQKDKVLVFCRTKRGADRLVDDLRTAGVQASAIHGDLRQEVRERALAGFTS